MQSSCQLAETIGQGDSRRASLICPRSSSSLLFTAMADTVLVADSFKILEDNNNRGGGLFLKHKVNICK